MWFDQMAVCRALAKLTVAGQSTANRTIAATTWVAPWLANSPTLDNVDGFVAGDPLTPSEHSYTFEHDGEYTVLGRVRLTALNSGKVVIARLYDPTGAAEIVQGDPITYNGVGNIGASIVAMQRQFSAGDTIRLEAYHNDSVSRTLDDDECRLEVYQVPNERS